MKPLDRPFSIVKGLYEPEEVAGITAAIMPVIGREDLYANKARGTIWFHTISPIFGGRCFTPIIQHMFEYTLGPCRFVHDKQQCVSLLAGEGLRGTIWHQEAATIPENSLVCWINLSPSAGAEKPGLSFVDKKFTEIIPTFFNDYAEESAAKDDEMPKTGWPIVSPVLEAGDAVFFDRYTIHRTNPVGSGIRIALKFTATKV